VPRKGTIFVDFTKVCVTNQFSNRQTQENAELNMVELIDQRDLGTLLERFEVTLLEVEKLLFSEWQDQASAA
jgi:type II secretory pathway component PulJ